MFRNTECVKSVSIVFDQNCLFSKIIAVTVIIDTCNT